MIWDRRKELQEYLADNPTHTASDEPLEPLTPAPAAVPKNALVNISKYAS